MTPYGILGLALLSVVVTVILALVFPRRQYKYKPIIQSASDIPVEHRYGSRSNMSFEKIRAEQPVRTFGKRPVPPLNSITLTARQLEHVNIQRKLRNRPPLNRAGFNNAVAHAWDQPRRQPDTSVNWLTYLILYECFFTNHQANTVADTGAGLCINPSLPYNGQVGEVPGAGASGSDVIFTETGSYKPGDETGSYQPGNTVGGYGASQEPSNVQAPAPDPAPSVSDSSPSYSSSSSSDSGSSYSGSSDSGGGGGGGGGGGDGS